MEKRVYTLLLIAALSSWTMACAPAPQDGEMCAEGQCTETSLNAPVGQQPDETDNFTDENSGLEVRKGDYDHIDPKNVVPDRPLQLALAYFDANYAKIKNKRWLTVFDASQHSSKSRLYLIDMTTGAVSQYHVSVGVNSDPDGDGYATKFSNTPESKMSSLGFYLTAETYVGGKGYSMRLDGLQSTNNNARSRAIVVHPASYVSERSASAGRSWGCPALDPAVSKAIIDKVKNGSLFYLHYKQ